MNRFNGLVIFIVFFSLTGCGAMMKNVMRNCDNVQPFNAYSQCIKTTYSRIGNTPNSAAVRAFYSNLDMITEAYLARQITDAQARAFTWDAYLKTIQASNDRNDAIFWNQMNTLQQQQQIQTLCTQQGMFTTCTTN